MVHWPPQNRSDRTWRKRAENGRWDEDEAVEPSLAALFAEPFRILRPFRQTVPFVFASPHSGRLLSRQLRGHEPA